MRIWKRLTPRAHWGMGWMALGLGLFIYHRFILHESTLSGLGLVAFGGFRVYQDVITPNVAELE